MVVTAERRGHGRMKYTDLLRGGLTEPEAIFYLGVSFGYVDNAELTKLQRFTLKQMSHLIFLREMRDRWPG